MICSASCFCIFIATTSAGKHVEEMCLHQQKRKIPALHNLPFDYTSGNSWSVGVLVVDLFSDASPKKLDVR